MRWIYAALAALVFGVACQAQVMVTPLDTSTLMTRSEAQATVASIEALIPQPASSAPPTESINGAAGSSTTTYALADHQHPRITRAVAGTTTAAGTLDVTWAALASVPRVMPIPTIAAAATQPTICEPVAGTITTTGATIKCFTTQNVTVSALGAVVAPVTTAAAGVSVQVFAIPGTP